MATIPPKCKGTAKSTGKRCTKNAIPGGTVCYTHGGAARQVKAAAQIRLVEQEARTTFGRLTDNSTPVTNPLTALSDLAGHAKSWMEFLAGKIADLQRLAYESPTGGEQIKGEIVLFERAMDRLNTVLATVARLNIDERLVAISEKQADMVIAALNAGLDAAGVGKDMRAVAKQAAARHLKIVKGA